MRRRFACARIALGMILALLGWTTAPALAAPAPLAGPPKWVIASVAGPSYFKPNSSGDLYVVTATNVGGEATSGLVTIEDSLEGQAEVTRVVGEKAPHFGFYGDAFTLQPLSCPSSQELEGEVSEKSKVVKGLSSTSNITVGLRVSGNKVPSGTTVAKVLSESEVELSAAIEGSGSATIQETLIFTPPSFSPSIKCTYSGKVDVGDILTFAVKVKVNVTASEGELLGLTSSPIRLAEGISS